MASFWSKQKKVHKIIIIALFIIALGVIFPLGNPITIQIFNGIYQPIYDNIVAQETAKIAPAIVDQAVDCIERLGGTYNSFTLECEM